VNRLLRRAALAIALCVAALWAGHLLAAPSQEDSTLEQSKAAARQEATQIVQSTTDKLLAQFPNVPPEKRVAIEAASQRFLSDVDNSFDHYAAALREIVKPSKAESVPPDAPRMRFSGSDPSVPDGKVVANSVSDRCEAPPSAASRAHNVPPSGRSVLCVCVDEKGTLTQDPVIAESSGDSRVDSGAVKLARLDSGRYKPPAVDGKPQRGCFRFAVNFRHAE
jgi:hypothetical protein